MAAGMDGRRRMPLGAISGRGATLHQKVVVTGVADIWRACGARAYNGGLGQSPSGVQGQSPWWGSGGEAP